MSKPEMTADEFAKERRFVDTDFGRIAYVERGEGPVALCLHGALLNGYQWRHQLSGLSHLRRVIAVDSMAMGYTEKKSSQPLGMRNQALMFSAFMEALGIEQADVLGNDSSGGAAQILAAEFPQKVRSLALTNCEVHNVDDNSEALLRFREGLRSGLLLEVLKGAVLDRRIGDDNIGSAYQFPRDLPDNIYQTYFTPLLQSPDRTAQILEYAEATTHQDLVDVEEKLRAAPMPKLIAWGLADDFFSPRCAHWLRDNLTNVVDYLEIEKAGVFWPEEYPQILNEALEKFWSK